MNFLAAFKPNAEQFAEDLKGRFVRIPPINLTEKNVSIEFIKPNADGSDLKIGIVSARFNDWACDAMFASCYEELKAHGVKDENIVVTTVPGALEIPGALVMLYEGYPDLDALVAIGCVIRGETYHFELVANESSRGVTDFVMTEGISVANCILTVENEEQAKVRVQEKGADAARVALEMGNLRRFCGQRVMENYGEYMGIYSSGTQAPRYSAGRREPPSPFT